MGVAIRYEAPPWVDHPLWQPPEIKEAQRLHQELFALALESMDDMEKVKEALAKRSLEGFEE